MRLRDDLRKTVVFFGIRDDSRGLGGIRCFGTGFLLKYDEGRYLVTARHLADPLKDIPFVVRVNLKDGGSELIDADIAMHRGPKWYYHEDELVDLAITSFWFRSSYDHLYLPEAMLVDNTVMSEQGIGVGNSTYTIGLFRLMHGSKKNLPIVHSGGIALLPGDELIPVRDWRHEWAGIVRIAAYLVEGYSLQGLSGSPVFVRPSVTVTDMFETDEWDKGIVLLRDRVALLGVWQGSWDAPPDEVLAAEIGREARAPLGLGVVVPAIKIKEILDAEKPRQERESMKAARAARQAENAAKPD